jgi:hypothetical protein
MGGSQGSLIDTNGPGVIGGRATYLIVCLPTGGEYGLRFDMHKLWLPGYKTRLIDVKQQWKVGQFSPACIQALNCQTTKRRSFRCCGIIQSIFHLGLDKFRPRLLAPLIDGSRRTSRISGGNSKFLTRRLYFPEASNTPRELSDSVRIRTERIQIDTLAIGSID